MDTQTLDHLAAELLDAYDLGRLVRQPSQRGPFSMADAYAVGERLAAQRRARGERTIGRKIGFTNTTLWEAYGVDRPMWAHVYAGTVLDAPSGQADISLARAIAPRIEPEVVFGLREAIPADLSDPAALLDHIAWLAPGFEIVDCHYAGWRFSSADCTADFGLHARLVVGQRVPVDGRAPEQLVGELARFTIELRRDGEALASGGGANVLGSPLHALGFLVETLAALGGEPLAAGEIVTTGTLTPALDIAACQTWQSAFSGLPLPGLTLRLT